MARLLIVDDNESDLALLEAMMGGEHELHVAANGEDAFRLFLHHDIDVVVTDIQMPRGDGIELISAIKGLDAETAIIAISGQKPHKLGIAQMAGATAILSKPVSPGLLREAVSQALTRATDHGSGTA